jgi:arylsulfatase A-like enzyme
MSRHELRNILFAWGPSFKSGVKLDNPSGNIDLTPTILRILGISTETFMDGRALEEALVGGPEPEEVEWSTEIHNAERKVGDKVYRQQIKVSRVGDTSYVDEGNSTLGRR